MSEHGRIEPLPDYVAAYAIAESLGVPFSAAKSVQEIGDYDRHVAIAMLEARRLYREETERERDRRQGRTRA